MRAGGRAENGGQLVRPTAEEAGCARAEKWPKGWPRDWLGWLWVNYFPEAFLVRFLASKTERRNTTKGNNH